MVVLCVFGEQWVIGSDVVVAQGRQGACVWYNIDTPDRVTVLTVAGDIMSVDRISGKTTVSRKSIMSRRDHHLAKST